MRPIHGAVALLAFLFVLGIAGTVEQGASLSRMALTIPALVIMALVVTRYADG